MEEFVTIAVVLKSNGRNKWRKCRPVVKLLLLGFISIQATKIAKAQNNNKRHEKAGYCGQTVVRVWLHLCICFSNLRCQFVLDLQACEAKIRNSSQAMGGSRGANCHY